MSPARIQRVHAIRTRIVAAAVAIFVGLFGLIGVRLASGHDPGLSKATSTSKSTSTTTTTTSSGDSAQLTTQQQPSQAVAPVTTSQS